MSKKRGFSIVEVVISLTIIILVSFSALTIVLSSTNKRVEAINKTEGQNFASDILECFKASNGFSDFQNNVYFALGETAENTNWETKTDEEGKIKWTLDKEGCYTYEKDGRYKAKITLYKNNGRQAIAIIVMKNKSEITLPDIKFDDKNFIFIVEENPVEEKDIIISFTYTKGGGLWV